MMFNLQLNFFDNYSAVVQAGVARIDTIGMRLERLLERELSGKEGDRAPKIVEAKLAKKEFKK